MDNFSDLFGRIFLCVCKHLAVSLGAGVVHLLLNNMIGFADAAYWTGLYLCLFIANCTALILARQKRILEKLDAQSHSDEA